MRGSERKGGVGGGGCFREEGGGFREEQEQIEPWVTPWGEIRYELHKRCRHLAIVLFNIIWDLLVVVFSTSSILNINESQHHEIGKQRGIVVKNTASSIKRKKNKSYCNSFGQNNLRNQIFL